MQITIDDSLYQELVEKVGKANISEYVQAVLRANLNYMQKQKTVLSEQSVNDINVVLKKADSSFNDVFGILKSDKYVNVEDMK